MRVYKKGGTLEGLRLIDEDGNYVFDQTWYSFDTPEEWRDILELPQGTQIIGYKCETEGFDINKLAFQLL